MTRDELLAAYNNGERDFSGKDFSGMDLNSENLSEANFSNCNFTGANLKFSYFSDSNCTNANFTNCDLNGTDFWQAILINANFTNVNQEECEANFRNAIYEAEKEFNIEKNITHTKTFISCAGRTFTQIQVDAPEKANQRYANIEIELEENEGDSSNQNELPPQYHKVINAEMKVDLYIYAPQNQVLKVYWDKIEEGVIQIMKELPFSLYKVKVKVLAGSYNHRLSNPESFKDATIAAIKEILRKYNITFYTPYYSINVRANENYAGDILGVIFKGRGMIESQNSIKNYCQFNASMPYLSILNLEQAFHSIDAASTYNANFLHYGELPFDLRVEPEAQLKSFLMK